MGGKDLVMVRDVKEKVVYRDGSKRERESDR